MEEWTVHMADREKGRKLIPPKTSRQRTIVYVVLITVVAIILIVVALALTTNNPPDQGNQNTPSGGGLYSQPQTTNRTSQEIKVDTFTVAQNGTDTTFLVTVTNSGNSTQNRSLNVAVGQTPGVPIPNQPYPAQETPTNNPVLTNSTAITIAPGETNTFPVAVQTPPGFIVDPGLVVITVT
jgi:hypothetical protein